MTVFEQLTWQRVGPDKQSPLSSLQATMVLLRLLMILLALVVSDLHSLPWFINVSEREGPGTILQSFSFNCSSHMPTLELVNVQPPTTFFNPPSLTRWQGIYVGKVTLSSSARLDALAVNHYELRLRYTCGNIVMEGPLFVDVQRDSGHIQCIGRFASSGGETIQVPETVKPGARLYTLLLPGLEVQGTQMNIISAQDPPYFPGPFSINEQGWLRAPSQGLKGQAQKIFQLQISVSLGQGQSCQRMLVVKILPAPSSQVSFLRPRMSPFLKTKSLGARWFKSRLGASTCAMKSSLQCPVHSTPSEAVNATLDCDIPGTCFQHAASILVLDGGQPQMTTEVPVLVMVTPVNEFTPACAPRTFRVQEDAGPHTLLGTVVGTDMDYPHNSIEYYTSDGSSIFAVDHLSGDIHLLGTLDYEQQRLYRLTILLIDHGQDWDPTYHRSGSCTITIEVEDVNDHPPECEPPFQELTIYTTLGHSVEVTKVSCWIPQEPQRLAFSYSIIGGDSKNQFRLQEAILMHNDSMLGPPWQEQPCTYELLIRAADAGPSIPHLSTTVTIIVHLVPWRASTVAMSTQRTTVPSVMTPLLVTYTETFWQPEPWFVVVLTATGALLLLALGWLVSRLLQRLTQVLQAPSKPAQALRLNSIQGNEGSIE
ncbi:cadherin-related family member 4 isoform X4 [Marmota monax]|uniref:cadherin-related family member 4 isoform X4 n=1 Tax=Marmota monax TaxID=9995 RepID=UPI001EB0716C|nr:cadherin-related family member 4 isoform X4 [Marmota monax]